VCSLINLPPLDDLNEHGPEMYAETTGYRSACCGLQDRGSERGGGQEGDTRANTQADGHTHRQTYAHTHIAYTRPIDVVGELPA